MAKENLSLEEVVTELASAFEEFKATHSAEILEFKKKGTADVVTAEKLQKLETELVQLEGMKKTLERLEAAASRRRDTKAGSDFSPAQLKHADAFKDWFRKRDPVSLETLQRAALDASEGKAVSSGGGSAGVAIPEVIGSTIFARLQAESPMRSVVNVTTIGTADYKELVDVNGESGGWVGETDTRSATLTPALVEVAPTIGEQYAYPEIYEHILDDAFFDVQAWLIDKVVRTFARMEGEAFISGNGSNKPTGFLNGTKVAVGDFESPARPFGHLEYVPTGAAGAFQNDRGGSPPGDPGDVFFDAIHALRPGWRAGSVWVMNTTTKGIIRKMKDSDGSYLLRAGLEIGEGSQLLGYGIEEMDHMPDVAANSFPIAFGNFGQGYMAVERTGLRITVDDNITKPGSVRFYIRKRIGGKLRNDQCIKLIRAAAS